MWVVHFIERQRRVIVEAALSRAVRRHLRADGFDVEIIVSLRNDRTYGSKDWLGVFGERFSVDGVTESLKRLLGDEDDGGEYEFHKHVDGPQWWRKES